MRKLLLIPVLALAACNSGAEEPSQLTLQELEVPSVVQPSFAIVGIEHEHLARLMQVSPSIYSGAQPHTAAAFASLKELGIKTVVSVDGARPNIEAAALEGLQYIHIPIGYDAISESAGDAFAKVMAEAELPVYFHCHHGRQRGPAGAAIALRASTHCDATTALAVLEAAGTSAKYSGLWRDVEGWMAPRPGKLTAELVSIQELPTFTVKMADLDRTWDRIKLLRKADWESVSLIPETQLLLQQLQDSAGQIPAEYIQDQKLHSGLEEVIGFAERLQRAAEALDKDLLEESYSDLRASCNDCHADYRNK
ncbi:MAG: hypothetical protein O3A95_09810 [Planctomycetota bacterium]|nr:hypothetical protein [Planctomycetota bacterium]MDA1114577.1 hypothetical protein [Planctomycetota bacterium]